MDEKEQEIAELKARLASLEAKPGNSSDPQPTLKKNPHWILWGLGLIGFFIILYACSHSGGPVSSGTGPSPGGVAAPSSLATVPEVPTPSMPTHHWQYKEGQEYGYETALSDDDAKSGKAAGEVLMFRFLGEKEGLYTVASHENGMTMSATCANPCEVVKMRTSNGYVSSTQRIAFNEASVVGSALTDAFNGQMNVYKAGPQAEADVSN